MIFKTTTDVNGEVGNHLNKNIKDLFNGNFFAPQSFSLSEVLSSAEFEDVEKYNNEYDRLKNIVANSSTNVKDATIAQKAFDNTLRNSSSTVQTLQANTNGGKIAIDGLTKASKAAELGMRGLALAGNMLASFLVSSFIGLLINVANASDEIADSAAQIGNSFKETTSDLDDYKTKVDELRNTIDDSSSSIADVQNARKELMSIQDDLIEKYGTEESVVKSITDAVNGEANAWDQLKKKKWTQAKNEFNDTGKDGILKGLGRNIVIYLGMYFSQYSFVLGSWIIHRLTVFIPHVTVYSFTKVVTSYTFI